MEYLNPHQTKKAQINDKIQQIPHYPLTWASQSCATCDHNIERPNFRRHAVKISAKPDSIYQNHGKLKPGVVVASDDGDYIILEQPTILGWSTTNINTKETKDLELVRDMAEMRYLGRFDSKTEEGIFITDDDN